ncbi:MAG TPA: 3-deoxy-7-phosphoheptulonate synthase [Streptosporangiaceae bacterium]|nr:3-deoxy-7-phosphoheptulonate synthase [Streptosporangiaceae bacterium]
MNHPPNTSDLHVAGFQPLIAPNELLAELPLGEARAGTVRGSRDAVRRIVAGDDDRLLVVVGPCSVHDADAAVDYAVRLAKTSAQLADELCVVMRVYFEKPRTTVGWKGLINDPGLDGSHDVHRGLRTARRLLLDVLDLGLPVGCEFLDPNSPQYIADAVSWGAIGARTTESQVHRQLASGLSMPVGFKNGTNGSVKVAVDACRAAHGSHVFFGLDASGRASVVTTTGNPDVHVILRGGTDGPNYEPGHVAAALTAVRQAGMPPTVMIDASHGNSRKDHARQAVVAREIAGQIGGGQRGIAGVMIESFLVAGRQDLTHPSQPTHPFQPAHPRALTYGQSVTDACLGWDVTADVLADLADAVRRRRGGGTALP